jgi:cytochrome c biogenesis protein CcmG/thiol:disulfide interchange protein DsbE
MIPRRAFVLAPALLPLSLACEGRGSGGAAGGAAGVGTPAPAYQGKTLQGEYLALTDFRGKVVLLNVWATWCAPCRKELPELVALHEKHGPQDFTVLGVSVDRPGARGRLEAMVRQFGLGYPIVHDPDGTGLDAFVIQGYPTSFLIGRDGTLLWRRDGIIETNDGELEGQLKAALAG